MEYLLALVLHPLLPMTLLPINNFAMLIVDYKIVLAASKILITVPDVLQAMCLLGTLVS